VAIDNNMTDSVLILLKGGESGYSSGLMGIGSTELGVHAGEIRRTILSSMERRVEAKVGLHLLTVHQHSAIFVTFFQAPVDRVKLWSGFFNVSAVLIGHRTSWARVSAMPHVIMARLVRV